MGHAAEVKSIFLSQLETVIRPAEMYDQDTHVLFSITGGPVWIWALYGVCVTVMAAGAQARHQINGIALDTAAAGIDSGVDDVIVFPLDTSTTGAVTPNVAASCLPVIASLNAGGGKVMASVTPGEISLIISNADMTGTMAMYCSYYRMTERSLITVA